MDRYIIWQGLIKKKDGMKLIIKNNKAISFSCINEYYYDRHNY